MAEILKDWLSQTLERPIKWEAEEFGNMMKNGHVIATVLKCYHIINDEKHYLIRSSNEEEDIKSNWKYLTEWLKDVEVTLSEADLNSIMVGKGSSLLRLFYQLFLYLDKRDRINFIKRERKMVSNLVEKLDHRFTVNKVPEHRESIVDNLSKPLLDERQFIEWQKRKTKQIKESFDYLHHKYSKLISKIDDSKIPFDKIEKAYPRPKENIDIEKFEMKNPCKYHNYTYEELKALEENARQRKKSLIDSEWANEYMNNMFQRLRKRSDSEEFQRQMGSALSNSLWNACVTEEENKADLELAKKVMKLSQFEKQMCTQIMETKQQARNLVKNRIQGEKEYAEQREQQLNIFFDNLKDKIDSGTVEIDFEQKRQKQLHKKLYAEKMKRKRQIYYDICYETLLAIIDFAVKIGYFKMLLEGDVPQQFVHEWKCLFFKQQPVFDVLVPTEEILKVGDPENTSLSYDETVWVERDRQQVLDDYELQEYLDYKYPWCLDILIPNYDADSEERKIEKLGLNVLGHVIYTLLELKYPYPPKRLPAALPGYSAKVLLRGLPDKSLSSILQTLLNFQKIHAVRLESVINFCLREYQMEMIGRSEIEVPYDNFVALAQDEDTKELIKSMKSEEEMLAKSRELNTSGLLSTNLINTKQTQTPKSLPEDDITMSDTANLGKYAYDSLSSGEPLTDYLLAAMIVEYLKSQKDIMGFVIINYPNTYYQARILEEAFTGTGPPDAEELNDNDDILLEESIIKHRKTEIDPYKEQRISKILNDPHKKKIDKPFETYFTSYINLKQTIDISQELVIWELTQENSDIVDRFYAIMGINYSLFYEAVDKDLITQICKFIIGDFSFPLKSLDELFGENITTKADFLYSDVKLLNSKIVKSDIVSSKSKDRVRRNSKYSSKTTIETELEIIKAPLSLGDVEQNRIKTLESMIAQDNKSKSFHSVEEVKILAGEEEWIYGELPIAESIGISITSYWEEFEKSYIESLEHLFFAKRLQINYVMPYTRFLKDKMKQIITLPSNKQDIVSEFQSKYNEFEKDWRFVNLAKNEWHCRVKELQNKLYQVCDQRKVFAQQKRHALICDNWTIEELIILANTYISLMQMELNRSIMTLQILHDFYLTMLRGSPPSERLFSKDLTKIYREIDNSHSNKKGGDEKIYKSLKNIFQDFFIKNVEFNFDNNPFNLIIENNVKFAQKIVKDLCDSFRSLISKEYTEKAKVTPTKKKEGNNSSESCNLEEIIKGNSLKCLEEWPSGVNGEMLRFNLRILVLQQKCYADMKLFSDQVLKTFIEIQNDINSYYINEIKSVDRLCKYLHMAIEKGVQIPETLLLEYDNFVIDPNVRTCALSEQQLNVGNKSQLGGHFNFKMGQLARLRSQFKLVAPTGIILHKAFIYLIQDFIIFGKESQEGSLFPNTWKCMDPEQVQKLVFLLFGETAYVDWREFLIYCLQIRFPSIEELLQIRHKFRCRDLESKELISRDNFINEELWFEKELRAGGKKNPLEINLIKHFLFELYETEQDLMNYSAFLLAFCKDIDPIKGFVAALCVAIGKKICFSLNECGEVVNYLIKMKKYKDKSLACALKCSEQFINKLIQNVVTTCEGTTVEELKYIDTLQEEKKGKKKKTPVKTKKSEGNQSGRSDNSQKPTSQIKMRASVNVSKSTVICPPCEQPVAEVKVPVKEPEKVVEEPPTPCRDPNLSYEVSQTVIWNVLKICLPWHFQLLPETKESLYVNQVQEVLSRLESHTDNKDIYVCMLVSDPKFCKLLHKVKKFAAVDLAENISNLI